MANEWKRGTYVWDAGLGHTPTNLMNAIQSFLTQVGWVRASWDSSTVRCFLRGDRLTDTTWMFNGDGTPQDCGIHVELDTPNSRVIIRTFLENVTQTGVQIASHPNHRIFVAYDVTAPNNFLFIGGRQGFYCEDGRDGQPNNLAHFMIATFEAIPEYNGTDDDRVHLTTQGLACDLFGPLKFATDRYYKLCDTRNGNRNYTGRLRPYACRGAAGFNGQPQSDNPTIPIGPRDHMIGTYGADGAGGSVWAEAMCYTFGLLLTPRDGRYRLSPMMIQQNDERFNATCSGGSNVDGPNGYGFLWDSRARRNVPRFVVVDGTLIPFVNLTDAATSTVFRVSQVNDANRPANIGIEWPDSGNVVTVSGA